MFAELEAQNVGCTIVFLDVDDFKDINDTYGHQYGDELLKTVARVLDEQKPEGSMVYRFGGDEFIVFIPGDRHDTAEKYIKRVYDIMEQHSLFISHGIIYTRPGSGCLLYTSIEFYYNMDKSYEPEYAYDIKTAVDSFEDRLSQKADTNHLKVILIGKTLRNDKAAYSDFMEDVYKRQVVLLDKTVAKQGTVKEVFESKEFERIFYTGEESWVREEEHK